MKWPLHEDLQAWFLVLKLDELWKDKGERAGPEQIKFWLTEYNQLGDIAVHTSLYNESKEFAAKFCSPDAREGPILAGAACSFDGKPPLKWTKRGGDYRSDRGDFIIRWSGNTTKLYELMVGGVHIDTYEHYAEAEYAAEQHWANT